MSAVKKTITITEKQANWVQSRAINLSRLVQQVLDLRMASEKEAGKWKRRRD